ncbi:MAG TPA: hypothetical protein VI072_19440, partial [Polyangiaceae bacterium]
MSPTVSGEPTGAQTGAIQAADHDGKRGRTVAFKGYYDELAIYRKDVIIPFGFLSMSIQALLFAWIYARVFASWSNT